MKKIIAYIIIGLGIAVGVYCFVENIKNSGWFFVGSMVVMISFVAAVGWAIAYLSENKSNE